jgi:hypothetical protein
MSDSGDSKFPKTDTAQAFFAPGFDPLSDPVAYPQAAPRRIEVRDDEIDVAE